MADEMKRGDALAAGQRLADLCDAVAAGVEQDDLDAAARRELTDVGQVGVDGDDLGWRRGCIGGTGRLQVAPRLAVAWKSRSVGAYVMIAPLLGRLSLRGGVRVIWLRSLGCVGDGRGSCRSGGIVHETWLEREREPVQSGAAVAAPGKDGQVSPRIK